MKKRAMAPLVAVASVGSSVVLFDPVMYSTIIDAVHATAVPEETELKLGGPTVLSDDADR
jgi:hypothetical protein